MARLSSRVAATAARSTSAPTERAANEALRERIIQVLETVTLSDSSTRDSSQALKAVWDVDATGSLCVLFELLKRCLVVYNKDTRVERIFDLIGTLALQTSKERPTDEPRDKENIPGGVDFVKEMLTFFTRLLAAQDKAVRYRSCQAIISIVQHVGEWLSHDRASMTKVSRALLERTRDRVPVVRAQALIALHTLHLRQVQTLDEELLGVFERLVSRDPSASVRKAALLQLATALHPSLVDAVVSRARDVDASIRLLVYQKIFAQRVNPKMLSIAQRVELLRCGLSDRSMEVKKACLEEMLRKSWLECVCKGRLTDLLQLLDVEVHETPVLPALVQMLVSCPDADCFRLVRRFAAEVQSSCQSTEEQIEQSVSQIDLNELNAERAAVAYVCAQITAWKARNLERSLWPQLAASLLPCITDLCAALDYYHQHARTEVVDTSPLGMHAAHSPCSTSVCRASETARDAAEPRSYAFVVRMLLKVLRTLDMSDEAGRRLLLRTMEALIRSPRLGPEELQLALEVLFRAQANIQETTRLVTELVAGLHSTAEADENPDVTGKHSCLALSEALLQALLRYQSGLEQRHLLRHSQAANARSVLSRDLNAIVQTFMPLLVTLLSVCTLHHVTSEDSSQRLTAMRVLGLAGLIDRSGQLSMQHSLLLLHVAEHDVEAVRLAALRALIDWLCTHASEEGTAPDCSEISGESSTAVLETTTTTSPRQVLLDRLCSLLTAADTDALQGTVVEGFAKLIFLRRLAPDAELIKRLLLLFFTPSTADNVALRQCLAVFFPAICLTGDPEHRYAFEHAFLPTLRVLVKSPKDNPLATISPVQAGQYLLFLLDPYRALGTESERRIHAGAQGQTATVAGDGNVHLRLAIAMLNEILVEPRSEFAIACARLLQHLVLPQVLSDTDSLQTVATVERLVQSAMTEPVSALLRRLLDRFENRIRELLATAGCSESLDDTSHDCSASSVCAGNVASNETAAIPRAGSCSPYSGHSVTSGN